PASPPEPYQARWHPGLPARLGRRPRALGPSPVRHPPETHGLGLPLDHPSPRMYARPCPPRTDLELGSPGCAPLRQSACRGNLPTARSTRCMGPCPGMATAYRKSFTRRMTQAGYGIAYTTTLYRRRGI